MSNSLLSRAVRKYHREGALRTLLSFADLLFGYGVTDPLYARYALFRGASLSLHGVWLDLRTPIIDTATKARVVRGAYESNERALIMDHVPRSANVLELGGGIGFVATYLAEHLDVDATQVVVEANPDLLPVIERHRDLNDATFTTLGAAYDPASNRVRLRRDGPVTGTTTVGVDDKDEMGHPRSNGNERKNPTAVSVPGVSLAELVDQFGPGPFTLVADIEGAEEGLVTGELETLVAHCPRLILELHDGPSLTAGEIRARVFDAGYEEVDRMEAVGVYER